MVAVPKVHHVFNVETKDVFFGCKRLFDMDFIEGKSVEGCWEHLSDAELLNIVSQVASIFTMLQSIPPPQQPPGPVGCRSWLARGYWFPDFWAGPFSSKEELEAWFNHKFTVCRNFKQAPETMTPFHFNKLVLTHLDIGPRNLILDADWKAWLIDWGNSGIYSEGYEAASLKARRNTAPEFTDMLLNIIPIHEEVYEQLRWIMFALTTGRYVWNTKSSHRIVLILSVVFVSYSYLCRDMVNTVSLEFASIEVSGGCLSDHHQFRETFTFESNFSFLCSICFDNLRMTPCSKNIVPWMKQVSFLLRRVVFWLVTRGSN